jgi:hypothetical protein
MFKAKTFTRTCFEGSFSRNEWLTGPCDREGINPFCSFEDIIPSRFALGYDATDMDMFFLALDHERVGVNIIETTEITDFGDNVLSYLTKDGPVKDNSDDDDDDDDDDAGSSDGSSSNSNDTSNDEDSSSSEYDDDDVDDNGGCVLSSTILQFLNV